MEKKTQAVNTPVQTDERKVREQLSDLMRRCGNPEKPDPQAREELNRLISREGMAKEVMKQMDGLYDMALNQRINLYTQADFMREMLLFKCIQLKEELGYLAGNPLERLAIEQIVLCWLNLHLTELSYSNALSQPHDIAVGIYWEKRVTLAGKRYSRALGTLAKVRNLKLTLQVNNAQNQIINNG
ncbi:hypothetical protein GCM10023187_12360 [Nibrella viscosa]|uniref:Uncharacterized protein n=1 Tax=Nibrella viscosa TaxID=1084524 RepID=A0ABP8K3X0_9BACT